MRAVQLAQEPVERVLFLSLLQFADQPRRREEAHPQPAPTGCLRPRDRDVSLSSAMAPNQTTVVLLFDPLATRQLQHRRLGELRQDAEIVDVEVLQNTEPPVLF